MQCYALFSACPRALVMHKDLHVNKRLHFCLPFCSRVSYTDSCANSIATQGSPGRGIYHHT